MQNAIVVRLIDEDPNEEMFNGEDEVIEQELRLNQASQYVLVDKLDGEYRVEATDTCTVKVQDKQQQTVTPDEPTHVKILRGKGFLIGLQQQDLPSLEEAYKNTTGT